MIEGEKGDPIWASLENVFFVPDENVLLTSPECRAHIVKKTIKF